MDEGKAMGQWAYYGLSSSEDEKTAALNEVAFIERELKKRIEAEPFAPWGRKQQNDWDRRTNFIYKTRTWDDFKNKTSGFSSQLRKYALNRWFNFWSANGVENIFCSLPGVEANLNQYDRLVDFSINNIPFDHKTTVYPRRYNHPVTYAIRNPLTLVTWLYNNQSKQGRYHTANRLFIVLYDKNNDHWRLRAELEKMRQAINDYVLNFDSNRLLRFSLNHQEIISDIIWIKAR